MFYFRQEQIVFFRLFPRHLRGSSDQHVSGISL
jgi:hypothetical protein